MTVSVAASVRRGRGVVVEAGPEAGVVIGERCDLGDGSRVLAREGSVTVGDDVVLGERCSLVAHAEITVGDGAWFGDGAMVVDFDHSAGDVEVPVRLQPLVRAAVSIGAGARIGHGACVLRGVTIGAGAVVGAHAVVTRDVPAGGSVAGVPARPAGSGPVRVV